MYYSRKKKKIPDTEVAIFFYNYDYYEIWKTFIIF